MQKGRITIDQLIEVYGAPEATRMNNGPEMTSETFMEWAKEKGIALLFIQLGKPNQNAFVERFNRSFRDELLDAIYSTQLQRLKRPLRFG